MKFYQALIDQKISRARVLAEQFFETELHVILSQSKFTHTDKTPEQVFNHIASNHQEMTATIKPWKPFNPWTSAIATTYKRKPGEIYINVKKINQRSVAEYVATLVHEALHLAPLSFGHGSNSPKGKENSVNYWVDAKAEEWARGKS
jgi:uncharacterized protein (DUF885 family)